MEVKVIKIPYQEFTTPPRLGIIGKPWWVNPNPPFDFQGCWLINFHNDGLNSHNIYNVNLESNKNKKPQILFNTGKHLIIEI